MRRGRVMTAALAMAVVAGACTSGGGSSSRTELKIATNSEIDSLNPFVAFNQDAYTTFEYVYPYLVQYDTRKVAAGQTTDAAIVGDFATSWQTSKDALTWTFHTRPGAKWSDGQPLTARDAAFTLSTVLKYAKGPTSNTASLLLHVATVQAPNANTLMITYSVPVANVLSQLQQMPILPEHIWKQYATGNGSQLRSFKNSAPVVSGGPFVLKEFRAKDVALFTRNPNFYGPKPRLAGFGLEMFRNDDAMIQALKRGEIDMIEGGGGTVPPTAVKSLKSAGFTVSIRPGMTFYDFINNANPKKPKDKELLDPRVRRAFAHAIDRNAIDQTVFQGYAEAGTTIVPPADGPWHDSAPKAEPFDVGLANRILDKAGYKRGANGIRVAAGHPMSYTVLTPQSLFGVDREFTILQGAFQKIGVQLSQRSMDPSAMFADMTAPGSTGYLNWDLALWDWTPLIDPDFILSVLTCAQWGGWGDSGYCNQAYDRMYEQQGRILDAKARQHLVWRMQEKLYRERPYVVVNYLDNIEVYDHHWTGFIDTSQSSFNPLSKQSLEQVHYVA
jgi:peptide/nickel transport system substrate-binding protein